ncbi:MAG: spermidine synthase [Acidobacteriota bacterium]
MTPAVRTFLASFLVLFLEVALIRWMPSHIRLLSYFSNFILLASFLGIGLGCLVAAVRPVGAAHRAARLPGHGWFATFPVILLVVIAAVHVFRLEVAVPSSGAIYFTSGTSDPVVPVESTLLLPVMFVIVAALFTVLAQRMAREMACLPPLHAYSVNLAGSLAGVVAFGLCSWLEQPPVMWFGVASAAALPLLLLGDPGTGASVPRQPGLRITRLGGPLLALAASMMLVSMMARDTIWSPYYKIDVRQEGDDTVVEVNNIFHQSMAPLAQKEYFYEWPYNTFGDSFGDVLILGAGSGTDVAAALKHGARHVDAVEIDPAIQRLGAALHPDRPYADPRVTVIVDDARHFLRTSEKRYDLVVFALIDSLTLQSSFSGVRLESYMFTEESFRAVRDRLNPDGLLVVYNYFREAWLVDRLANTAASAFGGEPWVHVHASRAQLGVLLAGPRLHALPATPAIPERVTAYGQAQRPAPAQRHQRDASVDPAQDDWPFLYLRNRHVPRHYLAALGLILLVSTASVAGVVRGSEGAWSWHFFLLGAGFMMLETRSITQFALLWGSTWVVASLAIASVLVMALAANAVVARLEITRPWLVGGALLALLGVNYAVPVGTFTFDSRLVESGFYAVLMFSPILCAGLLFGSAIKHSTSVARDYGANLLGAMLGGVAEYLSLVTGFRALLVGIALCYIGALVVRRQSRWVR